MRFYFSFIAALVLSLCYSSCDEVAPAVKNCDTPSGSNQPRRILIEEFTGIKCVNCPNGSAQITSMIAANPGRIVAVSIHTGSFSDGIFPNTTQVLTAAQGSQVTNWLGTVSGYPSSIIDQKRFDGESERVLAQSKWSGFSAQELCNAPQVSANITNVSYDQTSRQLSFHVTSTPYMTVSQPLAINAMITEDSIVTSQETASGVNDNYVHRHVLRQILSNVQGDPVSLPADKTYSITLDPAWNWRHIHIVGFVHNYNPTSGDFNVLQVAEEELH